MRATASVALAAVLGVLVVLAAALTIPAAGGVAVAFLAAVVATEVLAAARDDDSTGPVDAGQFRISTPVHLAAMIVAGPWVAALAGVSGVLASRLVTPGSTRDLPARAVTLGVAGLAGGYAYLLAGSDAGTVVLPDDVVGVCVVVAAYAAVRALVHGLAAGLAVFPPDARTLAGEGGLALVAAAGRGRAPPLGGPAPRPRKGRCRRGRPAQARPALAERMGGGQTLAASLRAPLTAIPLRRPPGAGRRVPPRTARRLRLLRHRGRCDSARLPLSDPRRQLRRDDDRAAVPPGHAARRRLAEIERNSRSQFHPTLARAFIAVQKGHPVADALAPEELRAIREACAQSRRPAVGSIGSRLFAPVPVGVIGVLTALVAVSAGVVEVAALGAAAALLGAGSAALDELRARRLSAALTRAWQADGLDGSLVRVQGESGPDEAELISWLGRHGASNEGVFSAGIFDLGSPVAHLAVPLRRETAELAGFLVIASPRLPAAHVVQSLRINLHALGLALSPTPLYGDGLKQA